MVSHDRTLLDAVPDGILHMAGGGLTFYPGNYTRFARTHAESVAAAQARQARIDAKRRQLQGFVDRFRYNASKARQAQSRIKALAKLADEPVAADERTPDLTFPEPAALAPPLLSLADVAVGYEPGRPVLRGLDLRIDPAERIALLGANGNGKSTFAKLLADLLPAERGTRDAGAQARRRLFRAASDRHAGARRHGVRATWGVSCPTPRPTASARASAPSASVERRRT